jgi:hypothetical protein
MDQEFQVPEDLYEREERCQKAIRTVRKALLMRLVVDGLMIWLVIRNPDQVWSWGLSAFVLLINTLGAVPLWQELQKQKMHLRSLIEQEEA